jgi:hypothetical protein
MSGDYSRIGFDPWLDDLGVLLQQGRPLTDRDWNDLVFQLTRRIHAGTLDTIGVAVYPAQTPDAFKIAASGGAITIGRGRMYVDGILAENHGHLNAGSTLTWDARLAELFAGDPLPYDLQPYYPDAPDLPAGGAHLVYLDVWQREVTRYIRPELVDSAIGLDTSTRLQTVWQVKVLANIGTGATCATPLDQITNWLPANAPSAGRLTTTTKPVPGQPDPCHVAPGSGYKGQENQLYRIEIHEGGAPGTATFKWSRDNASIETGVAEIPTLTQLVVDSVGKDAVLRFSDGDWIEITDDWLELHNEPGLLRRIKVGGGVVDATRTITLDAALPAGQFPVDAQNKPASGRRTRIRKWDQRGAIVDAAGTALQDLNASGSTGAITVPAGTTEVLLEHDIVASFSVAPAGGQFRSGDYWVFAARSGDATIEELTEAPPRGIHHHYAKLAIVTFPDSETDCRVPWPPPQAPAAEGDQCACTVCVSPEDHAAGTPSLQMAVDDVRQRGGGTICLEVGNYNLEEPLLLEDVRSMRIVGKGAATRLRSQGRAIMIDKSRDLTLESFAVLCRPTGDAPDAAVVLRASQDVEMRRLLIRIENDHPAWSALRLSGTLAHVSLRDNTFAAAAGISTDPEGGQATFADVRIDDNTFECRTIAVILIGVVVHQRVSRLHGNRVTGCLEAGFSLTGRTDPGHSLEIAHNVLTVEGHGILAGMDGLAICDNTLLQAEAAPGGQNGIQLTAGGDDEGLDRVSIVGNRITAFNGVGVLVRTRRADGVMIKQNQIARTGHGIAIERGESLDHLSIENNQLSEIGGFGIRAEGGSLRGVTSANQIEVRGGEPAVMMVFEGGDNVFADNHCLRRGGDRPDVVLGADTLIVTSNRVQGTDQSILLQVPDRRWTVLGNICRGTIRIGANPLTAPWAPLNREGI